MPILPVLLGDDFAGVVPLAALLGWWVPAYCLRTLLGNMMLGYGHKGLRVLVEGTGLVVLLLLMLWWVPVSGLEGALRALLAAEWLMACLGIVLVTRASLRLVEASSTA